jgi:hypothetical protein
MTQPLPGALKEKKTFPAPPNYVWQIPTNNSEDDSNPLIAAIFADKLIASEEGIIAKDAFVFAPGKHPLRNIFVFYRKEIGDVVFPPDDIELDQVERQEWMEKTEEDALAEIESRAEDPASDIQERLVESILGFHKT